MKRNDIRNKKTIKVNLLTVNLNQNPAWSQKRDDSSLPVYLGVFCEHLGSVSVRRREGGQTQATQKTTLFPRGSMLHPAMNGALKNIILVTRFIFRPSQPHHFVCRLALESSQQLIGCTIWVSGFELFKCKKAHANGILFLPGEEVLPVAVGESFRFRLYFGCLLQGFWLLIHPYQMRSRTIQIFPLSIHSCQLLAEAMLFCYSFYYYFELVCFHFNIC